MKNPTQIPSKSPQKTSRNNLPSPLPNPNVEIGNFLDCPPILSQSEAHPRGQPHLTPSFFENRPQLVRVTLRTTRAQGENFNRVV
jgi:hypothetical protein